MLSSASHSVSVPGNPANLWNILSENQHILEGAEVQQLPTVLDRKTSSTSLTSDSDADYRSDSAHSATSYGSSFTCATERSDDDTPTVETLLVTRAADELQASSPEDNELASKIINILRSYSPPTENTLDRSVMVRLVQSRVARKEKIHLILPAFPFKSPNKVDKVLGCLPDMGEEIALATLNGLCQQIDEVYPVGGTTVMVVSDGIVYNDLLGVSETEVWNYSTALRKLAAEKFPHITFSRLSHLIGDDCPEPKSLEVYLENADWYRSTMVGRHLNKDFDVSHELKHHINALMTYRGYIKFLGVDLAHEPSRQGKSKSQVKKMNEKTAKKMIERGAAFALALQNAFPTSVRISIHQSVSEYKLPIALLPGAEAYITPWHAAPAFELDGSWKFAHKHSFSNDDSYELIYKNDQPSYYRKISDLYSWDNVAIEVTPVHPCGLMLSPTNKNQEFSMEVIDMQKIRKLSEYNSPIILRGFKNTTDLSLFTQKAREMGDVMPWKFGEVLVVKDAGENGGGLNNVLSAEPMPFHFDGLFKTTIVKDEKTGEDKVVPQPPKFQWFTVATPAPQACGMTLIASSRLLFSLLPKEYNLERLQDLTWTVSTTAFDNAVIPRLPLVEPHPILATPCIRYHEPWPTSKTKFDPTYVTIDDISSDESQKITDAIDSLLYDPRVCYYHTWVEGDLILSDNISMMHTRSEFIPNSPRELWRIHIN
ncbi:hypothetical protein HYALB_00009845 [Hymenoscyphus albidus]|uniref:TauD/TfdA-like domain-containing protein n=1 Tax=Hymenoscyphus albidus TaxID=595503 RepID=A0A9N9LZ75_9HELO|nr:hypothetical protein HYALB_00009845 [Hymenoscyphus albidus]